MCKIKEIHTWYTASKQSPLNLAVDKIITEMFVSTDNKFVNEKGA